MTVLALLLAQVAVNPLIHLLIVVIIVGAIFSLLWRALSFLPIASPFLQVAEILLALVAVLILISLLLPLAGGHL
jgi:hypothetical protein